MMRFYEWPEGRPGKWIWQAALNTINIWFGPHQDWAPMNWANRSTIDRGPVDTCYSRDGLALKYLFPRKQVTRQSILFCGVLSPSLYIDIHIYYTQVSTLSDSGLPFPINNGFNDGLKEKNPSSEADIWGAQIQKEIRIKERGRLLRCVLWELRVG